MNTVGSEKVFDFANAAEWEIWLKDHYDQSGGVWLRIAKKNSGKTSVTIPEALDVSLCFGWIDSQRKGLDKNYYLQRYSPRRAKSPWSKINKDRTQKLIEEGRMQPAGLRAIKVAKLDGRWPA